MRGRTPSPSMHRPDYPALLLMSLEPPNRSKLVDDVWCLPRSWFLYDTMRRIMWQLTKAIANTDSRWPICRKSPWYERKQKYSQTNPTAVIKTPECCWWVIETKVKLSVNRDEHHDTNTSHDALPRAPTHTHTHTLLKAGPGVNGLGSNMCRYETK